MLHDNPFAYQDNFTAESWIIRFAVPVQYADFFSEALSVTGATIVQDDAESIVLYFSEMPDEVLLRQQITPLCEAVGIAFPVLTTHYVEAEHWVATSQRGFSPVSIGNLTIAEEGKGRSVLKLDAGAGFGTPHHGTTRGCLEMLAKLGKRKRFATMLDVGCGTGILALFMAKQHPFMRIVATDADSYAVGLTQANAKRNGVRLRAITARGFASSMLKGKQFDLITANLLFSLHKNLAKELLAHLKPEGCAILSGLLPQQAKAIKHRYRQLKGQYLWGRKRDGWCSIVLYKSRKSR